jgi:hypothetical protein
MPTAIPNIVEIIVAGMAVINVPSIKGISEYLGSSDVGYHSYTVSPELYVFDTKSPILIFSKAWYPSLKRNMNINAIKTKATKPLKRKKYFIILSFIRVFLEIFFA